MIELLMIVFLLHVLYYWWAVEYLHEGTGLATFGVKSWSGLWWEVKQRLGVE